MQDKKNRIEKLIISDSSTLINALKQMDLIAVKLLLVSNAQNKLYSVVSIGDIQRAIIANADLNDQIKKILRNNISVCKLEDSLTEIKSKLLSNRSEFMPIVDENDFICDVCFWEDFYEENYKYDSESLMSVPLVIMAGGKGTRMQPLTNIIPKALVPIGEKPIIQIIVEQFNKYGVKDFFISINYKGEMIRQYFDSLNLPDINITYFEEPEPLGTAGSLYLIKNLISDTFFVTNCDILIDQDYTEVLNFHKKNKNELTVIGALKNYSIPYGTLNTESGGRLIEFAEKPNLTFVVNTGLYILEPHLCAEIPDNKFYHIRDLMNKSLDRRGEIGVFPVTEGSWMDIGEWNEYDRTQDLFKIRFK